MEKKKRNIFITLAILLTLGIAFWYGGNAPGLKGWSSADTKSDIEDVAENTEMNDYDDIERRESTSDTQTKLDEANAEIQAKLKEVEDNADAEDSADAEEKNEDTKTKDPEGGSSGDAADAKTYSEEHGMEIDPETGKDKYATDPVPEGKPVPVEPENKPITDVKKTATLSVRADTLVKNPDVLPANKVDLVPADGVIYPAQKVTFSEGESVFDLLLREMKKSKIHMEFTNTPMYNSAYIEGINNLYEFDGGELSGWMYKVNGWFPNYGASRYGLEDGDVVEWHYTIDMGKDIGGSNSLGG